MSILGLPRIFECFALGSVWLFSINDGIVPYSAGSDVKSVVVVLCVFIRRLLVMAHSYIL